MHKKSHDELIKGFDDPSRDEWQNPSKVLKLMGDLKNLEIIDIGAGSGYFTKYFINHLAKVTAADIDPVFLKHLSQVTPKASLKKVQNDDPLMPENSFDIAFTSNTYHHFNDRIIYLKKILNGLKKNGRLVIVDFNPDAEDSFGPPHKMRISISVLVTEVHKAGFKKIQIDSDFKYHYLLIATK
jgi:SAM-dependent methyltransferase